MLKISGSNIQLTRGDTAYLQVTIDMEIVDYKMPYEIKDTDVLRLTVKTSEYEAGAILQKTLIGTDVFNFTPSDTQSLKFGSYVYDVELTTAEGDVFTVIPPSKFEIMKEVTW